MNNTTSTVKSYSNRIVYDYKLLSQIQIHLIPFIHIKKSLLTNQIDMYPLYWTTSKGGIFMRYSYEFKRKAIELFHQGEWPETPTG
ncbi:MAG: hypothetical protein MR796_00850, partial [Veillonella caviae]|nr:hypothetical protein [Veillonella caviae]